MGLITSYCPKCRNKVDWFPSIHDRYYTKRTCNKCNYDLYDEELRKGHHEFMEDYKSKEKLNE